MTALVAASSASATTLTVSTTTDEMTAGDGTCSLREAIAAVNSPGAPAADCGAAAFGPNTIALGAQRYTLTIAPIGSDTNANGDLNISGSVHELTISGAGQSATAIDATGLGDRVLEIASGADVTVTGLTITGGRAPDGAAGANGTGNGNGSPGTPGGNGGGIENDGTLTVADAELTRNAAGAGGTGGLPGTTGAPAAGNGGDGGGGGGIYSTGVLTLTGVTISGNRAGAGGTGGHGANASPAAGNGGHGGAGGVGGGVTSRGATATISGSTIMANSAGASGAGGDGGEGTGSGGDGGFPSRAGEGGGIASAGTLTLTNSTLVLNVSGGGGEGGAGGGPGNPGGDGAKGGTPGPGGALAMLPGGVGTLVNMTVVGNSVGVPGSGGAAGRGITPGTTGTAGLPGDPGSVGGLLTDLPPATLRNSVVASNPGGNCNSGFTDGGHNISFGDTTCPGSSGDPKLGPLADNGGPTETISLQAGSAALDQVPPTGAGCPATDQRGVARPAGPACDIGAFEAAVPANTAPPAITGSATLTCSTGTWANFPQSFSFAWLRDGQPVATGASYTPAGADVGHRLVCRVTATNQTGSASADSAARTITALAPPPGAPVISALRLQPAVFVAARRGASVARVKKTAAGTTVSYSDTVAGTTTFTALRRAPGIVRNRRCVARPRRAGGHARRCTRLVRLGSFPHHDRAGANRFHFTGRLRGRTLKPGTYRLSAVARFGRLVSRPKSVGFRIKRAAH